MRRDELPAALLPPHKAALYEEDLPGHLPASAIQLYREVRRRLRELEITAEHAPDIEFGRELFRATTMLRQLLAGHFPLLGTRCPGCRSRWGRSRRWPCRVWLTAHAVLASRPI